MCSPRQNCDAKCFTRERRDSAPSGGINAQGVAGNSFQLKRARTELNSFFVKMVPNQFHTPRMVANQIRRLRKHEQTTVLQRHNPLNDFYRGTGRNQKYLTSLCSDLVRLHLGAQEVPTVRDEILTLCANDPGVYLAFQETLGANFSNRVADLILGHKKIHKFWSKLFGRPELEKESSKFSYNQVIRRIPSSDKHISQAVMLEYLAIALQLDLKFISISCLLLKAWSEFIEAIPSISTRPGEFRWDKFDLCAKAILDTGKSINEFLPPRFFTNIARNLVTYSDLVPFILATFFAIPEVKILRREEHVFGAEISYGPLWNIVNASSYALSSEHELRVLTSSKTLFSDKVWVALYHVSVSVLSTYFHQKGFAPWTDLRDYNGDLVEALKLLAKNSDHNYTEEESQAAFWISQSFDTDRYHKRTFLQELSEETESINLLYCHSRFRNRFEVRNGLYDLAFMSQFKNVPYLRRYKIEDNIFITSDDLPAKLLRVNDGVYEHAILDYSIDTMLLDGHTLLCLRIFGEVGVFEVDGHYPILAGYSASGSILCVAAVRKDQQWYLNTVEEGARLMTYFDELGEECSTNYFFVLALRHDPIDYPPTNPCTCKGAMDPTGPIFWLKFWPEKDSDYYEDPRLTDDRILESFLNDARYHNERELSLLRGFEKCPTSNG